LQLDTLRFFAHECMTEALPLKYVSC